ncbi:hypothetical protein HLB44_25480 [Aquincola sp. S2]|uniref:Phasin domain-containing protein n=1 Tax=Pseudaquabacterium terrae TaxID=2732868 RepID=A0ABX2ENY8_9BURK|nr:hypothetical protein [Aquabacterium terrae]NRF70366.1 hypothetical protein [Aquabacterium terrae]
MSNDAAQELKQGGVALVAAFDSIKSCLDRLRAALEAVHPGVPGTYEAGRQTAEAISTGADMKLIVLESRKQALAFFEGMKDEFQSIYQQAPSANSEESS